MRVTGGGPGSRTSGSRGLVIPVGLRARRGAERRPGQHGRRIGERRPLLGRHAAGERVEQGVLVLLRRVGRRPPHAGLGEDRRKCSQSADPAGRRLPGTVFAIAATRPATDLPCCRSTARAGRKPAPARRGWRSRDVGRSPSSRRSGTRSSHFPTRRGRRGGGHRVVELHNVDPGAGVPDRAPPQGGAVGHQADLAEQGRGAAVVGHERVTPSGSGSGPAGDCGRRAGGLWSHHHAEPAPDARSGSRRLAVGAVATAAVVLAAILVGSGFAGRHFPWRPVALASGGASSPLPRRPVPRRGSLGRATGDLDHARRERAFAAPPSASPPGARGRTVTPRSVPRMPSRRR